MNKHNSLFNQSDFDIKGKSLRFVGTWNPHTSYINDSYSQDFVSHDGILWACMESCRGILPCINDCHWELAVKGEKGDRGKEIVTIYEHDSHNDGEFNYSTLMLIYSNGTNQEVTIKTKLLEGIPGKDGKDGLNGQDGKDGVDGKDGKDGVDGKDGKNGKTGAVGPQGPQGPAGNDGADGKDGSTPFFKLESGNLYYTFDSPDVEDRLWIFLGKLTTSNSNVDLSNYYTKNDVDEIVQRLEMKILEL